MAKVVDMPKLSPTMEEGQISAWHKKEGDSIEVDDLLAEVETDKATMEFRSFDKGTLLKILAPAGSVVSLGQPVAIVGEPGEDVSKLAGQAQASDAKGEQKPAADRGPGEKGPAEGAAEKAPADKGAADKGAADKGAADKGATAPREPPEPGGQRAPTAETGRVKASPYVRKLARERDLDLSGVEGSGPAGRIVARDLEGVAARAAPSGGRARGPAATREPEKRPLSMMRKAIARRLTESKQTVPHFYLSIDVDAGRLVTLRELVNDDLAAGFSDDQASKDQASKDQASKDGDAARPPARPPKVSYNDLLIKACAIGLRRVPECNAQFMGDHLLFHGKVDISVAVAIPDGLVTPVVRDADQKSVLDIASEVRDLARRARAKKLQSEEMTGGTFSISNLGMYGIDDFAAVINPPEGAILAVGQVREEPVVRGGEVIAGHRLAMTLSCDHRVVDGAVGASFLKVLRSLLEHPGQLLAL
jgi:pyruvate dehydrogenase E2 component (dihydrolipoamide acetyltransferase)